MDKVKSLESFKIGDTIFFSNFNKGKLYKYEITEILSNRFFNLKSDKADIHKNISILEDGFFYKYEDAINEYNKQQEDIDRWL